MLVLLTISLRRQEDKSRCFSSALHLGRLRELKTIMRNERRIERPTDHAKILFPNASQNS